MLFLGTAAAENFPNPFCHCQTCERARQSKDSRNIRRRSSFQLDSENLIDFNADSLHAINQFHSSLTDLKNLFITHIHEDHFDYWNMEFPNMSETPCAPLRLFASLEAAAGLKQACSLFRKAPFAQMQRQFLEMEKVYEIYPLPFYQTAKVDHMLVTPMKGRHNGFFNGEKSANYVLERPSDTLMYACDTGRFYEETFEWLAKKRLDILIIEGSFGLRKEPPDCGHMTLESLTDTLEQLFSQNTLDHASRIYVTHIAHKGGLLHEEYESILQQRFGTNIQLAYDGLTI